MDKIRKAYRYMITIFVLCTLLSCMSDYSKSLGNGYFFRYEGGDVKDILCERATGTEIPATVLEYANNKYFIIARQKPKIPQEPLYKERYHYGAEDSICFWIIVKKSDIRYGPLNIKDYNRMRKELKIPDNLYLK